MTFPNFLTIGYFAERGGISFALDIPPPIYTAGGVAVAGNVHARVVLIVIFYYDEIGIDLLVKRHSIFRKPRVTDFNWVFLPQNQPNPAVVLTIVYLNNG
ncbi:MAG: hypothetical protein GY820_33460 [Gammaproteobacteria bacterium]|nr:hypothetical protein [Gammaproteobacteria bacterium]